MIMLNTKIAKSPKDCYERYFLRRVVWCGREKCVISRIFVICRQSKTLFINDMLGFNGLLWYNQTIQQIRKWLLTMSQSICVKSTLLILGIIWFNSEKSSNDFKTQCSQLLVHYGHMHVVRHLSNSYLRKSISLILHSIHKRNPWMYNTIQSYFINKHRNNWQRRANNQYSSSDQNHGKARHWAIRFSWVRPQ